MSQGTRDQINSLAHFQQHSRLHFIGQWKTKMEDEFREWFSEHPEWNHGTLEQQRTFIHIDMDAFFCSVQLAKPEYAHLRTKPVGIAAGKYNSDISSCNYVARAFGIHAGMYVNAAKELCPELVTLGYDLERCEVVAKTLYRILFESFPPSVKMSVEIYSIDEVMVASDTMDYDLLKRFCATVRAELFSTTGCTASCGIGPNIMLARIATDRGKPNGIHLISVGDVPDTMMTLPLRCIHGAGESTMDKIFRALEERGMLENGEEVNSVTCASVQRLKMEEFQEILGKKQGETFYHLVRGKDSRVVTRSGDPEDQRHLGRRIPHSVGCTMNYAVRPAGVDDVWNILRQLLDDVCAKLRRTNTVAQGLRVTLLERHPLHSKETQKYMGRGKCVEVHLPVKLPYPMGFDQAGVMEREMRQVVGPLLVTSRAMSDAERAVQLGLSSAEMDLVLWTVTLSSLRDIVIEDVRGMTVQATGLRPAQDLRFTRHVPSGQQMTLATAFSNAKRPRAKDVVTVTQADSFEVASRDSGVTVAKEQSDEVAELYLLHSLPWRPRDEALTKRWCRGCERACHCMDYALAKAYIRCALVKMSEWPDPQSAANEFQELLSFAQARLPAPVDFC